MMTTFKKYQGYIVYGGILLVGYCLSSCNQPLDSPTLMIHSISSGFICVMVCGIYFVRIISGAYTYLELSV